MVGQLRQQVIGFLQRRHEHQLRRRCSQPHTASRKQRRGGDTDLDGECRDGMGAGVCHRHDTATDGSHSDLHHRVGRLGQVRIRNGYTGHGHRAGGVGVERTGGHGDHRRVVDRGDSDVDGRDSRLGAAAAAATAVTHHYRNDVSSVPICRRRVPDAGSNAATPHQGHGQRNNERSNNVNVSHAHPPSQRTPHPRT